MAASLGKQLQLARQARSLTLREISEKTRITIRHLEAIEADDYYQLPGGIFNKSFIKSYARQIGFDENEALEAYDSWRRQGPLPEEKLPLGKELSEEKFISFALFGDKIKMVSLAPDGSYRILDETQHLHNILYVTSSETRALQIAVEELESLINDSNAKEKDFQNFFERHPDFILNDEHKKAHPHIVLAKDVGETLIPDFVLEPIDQSSLCDLLELKLPSAQIFVLKKKRMRFSAAVLEACAQLREYSSFFDEEENRRKIQEQYGLLAFKPKMFVIIGRRGNISPIEVRKIESDVPNLSLRTYDDVITRIRARVEKMKIGRAKI